MAVPILGEGTVSAAAIQAWFVDLGPGYKGYAPDGKYKAPPANLGAAIVAECRRYAGYIVNHDYVAPQILKETAAWQSKYARERNNPGGIGAINSDPDQAIWFPTVEAGVRAHVAHLLTYAVGDGPWTHDTPRYANVKAKGWVGTAPLWTDLNGKWAWPGTTYGQDIISLGKRLQTFAATHEGTPPVSRKPIIALAAGHHNTDRGGAVGEYERVGPLTGEIARQLRAHSGFDVRVITPDNGMGNFAGGLQDVAREAVTLNADCFLEVHMQGVGSSSPRGCFAIYPDTNGDVDHEVRDTLGPDMAKRVRDLTGLPLWGGTGTMSERNTGVGGQGFRLGAFGASAAARATMTRLLFEYGTLTNPQDKAIIDGQGFNVNAARATVSALASFYGVADAPREPDIVPPAVEPYKRLFAETGHSIMHGFRAYWEQFGDDAVSIRIFGYPLTEELQEDGLTVQYFERAVFEWHPGTGVLLRRLGAEALEAA